MICSTIYGKLALFTFSLTFPTYKRLCSTCPKADPRFKPLVERATRNFDTFEDFGTNLDSDGKVRVMKNTLDQFYNYDYRRVRKPRVTVPDATSS